MAVGPPLVGKGVNPPIDTMHKGVRQGGNKSTKSFRSDIGIPGYTGFCPAFAALPPPTKGSTERLEKTPDQATFERLATGTVGDHRTSHYRDTMRPPKPALYEKARQTLQETARLRETPVNVQPGGYAKQETMYRSTIGRGSSCGAELSSSQSRPEHQEQSAIVYSTTYSRMPLHSGMDGERIRTGTGSASFRRMSATAPAASRTVRPNEVQSVGHERSGTHYMKVYGTPGHDPLTESLSLSDKHVTQSGTSFLDKGTVRGTAHIPGYSGHVPRIGGEAIQPRNSSTKDTLLYDLTQFSQGRTPFYSGFRPKAACNVRPPGEPSPQTTQGYANNSVRMLIEKRGGVLSTQRKRAGVAET